MYFSKWQKVCLFQFYFILIIFYFIYLLFLFSTLFVLNCHVNSQSGELGKAPAVGSGAVRYYFFFFDQYLVCVFETIFQVIHTTAARGSGSGHTRGYRDSKTPWSIALTTFCCLLPWAYLSSDTLHLSQHICCSVSWEELSFSISALLWWRLFFFERIVKWNIFSLIIIFFWISINIHTHTHT